MCLYGVTWGETTFIIIRSSSECFCKRNTHECFPLQGMLMGGSILGPGNIFLMLVGAFVAAFKIDNWTSFLYNIIPILIYMFVCFVCKSNIQVFKQRLMNNIL